MQVKKIFHRIPNSIRKKWIEHIKTRGQMAPANNN